MRKNPTEAEAGLWLQLRNRHFAEYKFRRQVPIGRYIVDFVCFDKRLIVELDGSQHAESIADEARELDLLDRGFRILRIWNNDWFQSQDSVLDAIWHALQEDAT